MPRLFRLLLLVTGFTGLLSRAGAAEAGWWEKLNPRDLTGATVALSGRWVVIVFVSPECPVANAAVPTLNALVTEFRPHGFDFVGAYPDPTLDVADLRKHAADYRLALTPVDDRAQRVVRFTGATYTPEVFVFSRAGTLLYRGRIDDRVADFGAIRPGANHEDLREVLGALAAGQSGPFAARSGFGCAIATPVTR